MALKNAMRVLAPLGSPAPGVGSVGTDMVVEVQTAAATATYDVWSKNAPFKFQVIDAWCIATAAGAAADTVTVQNGNGAASESFTAITDAMDLNVADKAIARATTIDDSVYDILRDESLRVATASGAVALVYIRIVPVS